MRMFSQVAVAVFLITTPLCAAADSASDMQELRAQVKALADQLKETQGQLKTVQGQLDSVLETKARQPAALTDGVDIRGSTPDIEAQADQAPATIKPFKTKYYVGGGVGVSMLDLSASDIRSDITNARLRESKIAIDDEEYSFKVFAGIRPSKYWGAEVGYAQLGTFEISSERLGVAGGGGVTDRLTYNLTARPKAYYLDALGYLPLKQNLSLVGRLGAYYWQNTVTAKEDFEVFGVGTFTRKGREKDQGYSVKYGLGLQYDLDSDFSIRGDWERYMIGYDVDSTHIDMWTLSGVMNF